MKISDELLRDKKLVLALGIGVIVVTNIVALGGVAYNRAGEPDAVVTLSERELRMHYRYGMLKESSGIQLHFDCRLETDQPYTYSSGDCSGAPDWLDRDKLIGLGFRLPPESDSNGGRSHYSSKLPREAYLVLEFNAAAYERTVARAEQRLAERRELMVNNPGKQEFRNATEQAQTALDAERHHNSRLFVIDVGKDKSALRAKYADGSRYILMRALVQPLLRTSEQRDIWTGLISNVLIDNVNLPINHRQLFEHLDSYRSRTDPQMQDLRYEVQVAFGKRAEPWVLDARPL